MGNCQVAEAAAAVVELPGGRVRRLHWPTPAAELMRSNPGHYVALVVVAATAANSDRLCGPADGRGAKATSVKLLKPKDMLLLGQVYKLITSQEVTKALRARKQEKMKKSQLLSESIQRQNGGKDDDDEAHVDHVVDKGRKQVDSQSNNMKVEKHERERHKSRSSQSQSQSQAKARQWRPSLQSITEVGS